MSGVTRCSIVAACLVAVVSAAPPATAAGDTPQEVIAAAARRVVKIHGAGGMRGLESYQSGVIISPDGRIATAASTVLDSDTIDCILDDGRRFPARLVGVDARRELALLAIEATDLPAFAPAAEEPRVGAGTRVIALSNLFGVAVGDERVSAQRGVVSAVVPLEARRGAAEAPYRGDVYILDCTTNNPGSAGGALVEFVVDAEGGHGCPGATSRRSENTPIKSFHGAERVWSFFKDKSRPSAAR